MICHICLWASVCVLLSGCGRGKRIAQENDRLRMEVHTLHKKLQELEERGVELESELASASDRPDSLPQDVRDNTPHAGKIKVGRLSHARDTDNDAVPDELMVYIHPEDGRGRFVQIVGTLWVHAAIIPADGEAQTLGRVELGPAALRDAYRATITGIYYSVQVPINFSGANDAERPMECTVRAEFADGLTGRKFSAERAVKLEIH